jgi:hypothetical protein
MIVFEVQINGQVVCIAGVGDLGVLTAILKWVRREPNNCPEGLDIEEWSAQELDLSIGGTVGHGKHGHQFLDWIRDHRVSVGDEIKIKILDQPECDSPVAKRIETSEFVQERKREYLEELKKEFPDKDDGANQP